MVVSIASRGGGVADGFLDLRRLQHRPRDERARHLGVLKVSHDTHVGQRRILPGGDVVLRAGEAGLRLGNVV